MSGAESFEPPLPPMDRPNPPWRRANGLDGVLFSWRQRAAIWRNFALAHVVDAKAGTWEDLPVDLHSSIRAALQSRGVGRLYTHQAEAFARARRGEDVVIATPTASGKSLCYNLPIFDALAKNPDTRALYLFPTKALARDQEQAMQVFLQDANIPPSVITYDGDTPGDARRAGRERSQLLITNPDMLHAGILPHHTSWSRFFAALKFVVIDELHMYRGVFGSHLANVIRRLLRVAEFHGAKPQFLFSSATTGNPGGHASRLLGRPVGVVDKSGAPTGPRHVFVYNPPVVNAELGIRASATKSAVRLAADLVLADVPTIVFGQSRNVVEVMLKYLRDHVTKEGLDPEGVQGYRGGYLPRARRHIEAGLRRGDVRCVVATNALELGIDIGSLDAVVCVGYPGSIAELWQRFGRAGRRFGPSTAILVTNSNPIDQYLARDAHMIVDAPVEEARVDPDNLDIFLQHMKCAAFELPFALGAGFGDVPDESVREALSFLADQEVLQPVASSQGGTSYYWASDAYPAHAVSLRNIGWDNVVIVDVEKRETIGEMDWDSTHTMLHEQAIYQHDAAQYQVERLDLENKKAFVRKVEPDYYTTAMTHTKVHVLVREKEVHVRQGRFDVLAGWGDVNVVEKVVGFKKIKFHSHENVGFGEVQLPERQKPTTSAWLLFPHALVERDDVPRAVLVDALWGLAHAMHVVATLGLMIDPRDLGMTLVDRAEESNVFDPTVFLYDQVAGGIGLAERIFEDRERILVRAAGLLRRCDCADGCPACVGPVAPLVLAPANEPAAACTSSRKRVALGLLESLGLHTAN